jgi:hypothetical protein
MGYNIDVFFSLFISFEVFVWIVIFILKELNGMY